MCKFMKERAANFNMALMITLLERTLKDNAGSLKMSQQDIYFILVLKEASPSAAENWCEWRNPAHRMRVAATCLPKIHFQDGSENKYRSNWKTYKGLVSFFYLLISD